MIAHIVKLYSSPNHSTLAALCSCRHSFILALGWHSQVLNKSSIFTLVNMFQLNKAALSPCVLKLFDLVARNSILRRTLLRRPQMLVSSFLSLLPYHQSSVCEPIIFLFLFFYCCSSTVVSILPLPLPPPHPSPLPTLDPTTLLWFCPCVHYTCSWQPSPLPPHYPLPPPLWWLSVCS